MFRLDVFSSSYLNYQQPLNRYVGTQQLKNPIQETPESLQLNSETFHPLSLMEFKESLKEPRQQNETNDKKLNRRAKELENFQPSSFNELISIIKKENQFINQKMVAADSENTAVQPFQASHYLRSDPETISDIASNQFVDYEDFLYYSAYLTEELY